MITTHLLKHVLLFFSCTVLLNSSSICALNIGVETTGITVTVSKECSRKCESSFCSVPPLLRYGKYCGLLYSGCPGERPCDGLDACCMNHDRCVQAKNNLSGGRNCQVFFRGFRDADSLQSGDPAFTQSNKYDYLSQECSQTFINCMNKFKNSRAPTFKGNTCEVDDIIEVISVVMEAALLAGGVLHKP